MDFLTIFTRMLPVFLRVFSNFTVSTEVYVRPAPHKKMEFFLTLVNDWNALTNVTKSSTLGIVGVLDMPLVSDGYFFKFTKFSYH